MEHRGVDELEAGVDDVRGAPKDDGRVELIVARPDVEERTVLEKARLDEVEGLVGDNWLPRGSSRCEDGTADPEAQVTVMNARAAALIAGDRERWPLAGDQLYVNFDIGNENLPAGTRLVVGDAVLEVSAKPHTGCAKFNARFGKDALRFVNSPVGRELNLRGINTKVITGGAVRTGDAVRKIAG
ncbi:MAG: MOSC domain-containing protein [Actinobacteria bacterium]|nr:MOSC domain-containing protein [Actinomycetota bacterium]